MFKIGFSAENQYTKPEVFVDNEPQVQCVARRSVVQVYFPSRNMTLAYYNDQFNLKQGDLVYVDGKLEGLLGRVTEVCYNFKIKVSDYKRVIAFVDTDVKGKFFVANSHFVTFDRESLPAQKVLPWFKAPVKEDDIFVSGNDDSQFSLNDLRGMDVSAAIVERGKNYYIENRVKYICLDGIKGYAIVEGSEAYEVEFEYHNGEISKLTCSCFCSYNCKHEYATMLQLRETLEMIEKHYACEYKRNGYFAAIRKSTLFSYAIDGIETGSFIL